ncbi:MAG: encapsulin-associated ferritin-like protein [Candidatus Zixiibacteriota bacterium]
MSQYHEPVEELSTKTRNITRAIQSFKEELEAIDWYNQRVDTTNDESLKKILEHNRDEEIEHACMTLEWLRRNMDAWDDELKTYLFTEGDITKLEEGEEDDEEDSTDLQIGKL